MLNKAKIIVLIAALSLMSASAFADQDLFTLSKKGVMGIYHHALKPIPRWVKKSAVAAKDGTVFLAVKLGDGGQAVGTAFYKSGNAIITDVADPTIDTMAKMIAASVKLVTIDIALNAVLTPIKDAAKAGANEDVVTGIKAAGTSEQKALKYMGSDLSADAQTTKTNTIKTWDATIVPVYRGTTAAAGAVYHAIISNGE